MLQRLTQICRLTDHDVDRVDRRVVLLCVWDRSGPAKRAVFQKRIRADLIRRRIHFIDLTGSLDTRVQTVTWILRDFDKFDSVGNHLGKQRTGEPAGQGAPRA